MKRVLILILTCVLCTGIMMGVGYASEVLPIYLAEDTEILLKAYSYDYTGAEIRPEVVSVTCGKTVLTEADYDVSWRGNIEPGQGTVIITGKGSYTGTAEEPFFIYPEGEMHIYQAPSENAIPLTDANTRIELIPDSFQFTDAPLRPEGKGVTVTCDGKALEQDVDYILFYGENIHAGKDAGSVTVIGQGVYTRFVTKKFTIDPMPVDQLNMHLEKRSYAWTGKKIKPRVFATMGNLALLEGTDYTLAYKDNKKVGTGTVIMTGNGDFTGTIELPFRINKADNQILSATGEKTLDAGKLSQKDQSFNVSVKLLSSARKTFSLLSVPKKAEGKITVSSSGKVTVGKGLPAGTYNIRIQVVSAATANCRKTTFTRKIKLTVTP